MAHMTETIFQTAHEAFVDVFVTDWVISVHGMSRSGISISDGTRQELPITAAAARLGRVLMAAFPEEEVTSCNAWEGAVLDAHLCGTTNTQGRYVNDSEDACTESSTTPSHRFVHLEQNSDVRAQGSRVADALTVALQGSGE